MKRASEYIAIWSLGFAVACLLAAMAYGILETPDKARVESTAQAPALATPGQAPTTQRPPFAQRLRAARLEQGLTEEAAISDIAHMMPLTTYQAMEGGDYDTQPEWLQFIILCRIHSPPFEP